MKYASTPILVKVLLVTGQSTKIGICSSAFILFGLRIVMLFVSFSHSMETTQLSFGCKCDWCAGTLMLSIKMTCISPTWTTGCDVAKTAASTRTSTTISSLTIACVQSILPWLTYPCFRRTCPIAVDRIFLHKLTPLFRTRMRPTAKPFSPQSLAVMVQASLISPTFLFGLVISTPLPQLPHMLPITTTSHDLHSKYCD